MASPWQQALTLAAERRQEIASHKTGIRKLFAEAKALYAPGGEFMAGTEAQLARGRKKAVAGGMQGLAAAGLAGTSMAGGLAKKYEEEVAAPTMAQATSQRLSALSGLLAQEASAEMQMAPRFEPVTFGGGAAPGFNAPRQQAAQPRQQTARPQPQQQQQQQPSPPKYAAQPTQGGGQAIYYGADYFRQQQQQQQQQAPAAKPLTSFYSAFQATAPKPVTPAPRPTSLSSIYGGTYY